MIVIHAKPAEDGQGMIVRLINLGEKPVSARLALPERGLTGAWTCGTLEERQRILDCTGGAARCELQARQLTTVRLGRK